MLVLDTRRICFDKSSLLISYIWTKQFHHHHKNVGGGKGEEEEDKIIRNIHLKEMLWEYLAGKKK